MENLCLLNLAIIQDIWGDKANLIFISFPL